MTPLSEHTGRTVPLRRSNVDTDQIIPSDYCKRVTKTGYADGLFARWRQEPDFVLNRPDRAGATVLLAGPNFGTGSSREHAVWALRDWGIVALISSRYGDIFHRNALKNGLLAVRLEEPVVAHLMDLADADTRFEITVDLLRREVRAGGLRHDFEVDDRARWLLLNGYDDIEVTLRRSAEIDAYEGRRQYWLPSVARASLTAVSPPRGDGT